MKVTKPSLCSLLANGQLTYQESSSFEKGQDCKLENMHANSFATCYSYKLPVTMSCRGLFYFREKGLNIIMLQRQVDKHMRDLWPASFARFEQLDL